MMDEDGFTDTGGALAQATPATAPANHAGAPGHNFPDAKVEGWTTSLCACFDDISNCLITSVCPCITFGQNAEIIDQGNITCMRAATLCCLLCNLCYCSFCYTYTYRTKLRGFYSIPGDQCGDCFVHLLCQPCALCQEYRELKKRGFDPSFGWIANQGRGTQKEPPSVPSSMER